MAIQDLIVRIKTVYNNTGTKKAVNDLNAIRKTTKTLQQAQRSAQKFRGELLSIMFFGMAIVRVFGGLLRSSIQTFQAIAEGTTLSANAFTRLSAAWEFFKFSLIDALLASPLFMSLITNAISLLDKFNQLSDSTKQNIALTTIWGSAIGGILMLYGMIGLGIIGLITVTKAWVTGIGGVYAASIVLSRFFMSLIAQFMVLIGLGKYVWLPLSGAIANAWIVAIASMIVVLVMLWKKFGGFFNALKAWGAGVVLAIAFVVQGVLDIISTVIASILYQLSSLILAAARAARLIPGLSRFASTLESAGRSIRALAGNVDMDIIPGVSSLLDKVGLNLEPKAGAATNQEVNISNYFNMTDTSASAEQIKADTREELERAGFGELAGAYI